MRSVLKGIFDAILTVVLIVLIFFVVCNIFLNVQKSSGSKTPNIFGFAPISISGNYMSPELEEKDFVIISVEDEYKKGDIITFISGSQYVTKKVVDVIYSSNGKKVQQYKVASINDTGLENISPSIVYGKKALVLKGFTPVVQFLQSVPGVSVVIVIIVVIIILPAILTRRD